MGKRIFTLLLALVTIATGAWAQLSYTFKASEWVAGDPDRISTTNVTVDETNNTITVNQTGDNNVSLNFKTSESYYVDGAKYFVIKAKGLSTADGKSYLWWLNAKNYQTPTAPTDIQTDADGMVTLVWDITSSPWASDFTSDRVYLDGTGAATWGWTTTFGLTQADASVPVVFSYIGYEATNPITPGILIDAEHFPDDNFRAYINSNFDTNHDGNLSNAEMEAVTKIEHNYGSGIISDLTGIELFTELEKLDLYKHKIQTVNLSNNKKLKGVSLEGYDEQSGLASLDVTGCTELEKLFVHVNHLTELDLSNNTKLQWLVCTNNQLTTLDLSNCSSLLYLICCINNISGEGMDALVNSLPTVTEGYFFPFYSYVYTPEELALSPYQQEANIITDVQVAVAKGKGWKVLDYYNSEEYEGVDTGISAIEHSTLTIDHWYTLDGKMLQGKPTRHGVYIVNGRKVKF